MSRQLTMSRDDVQVENLLKVLKRPDELPPIPEFRIAAYNVYNLFDEASERPPKERQLEALGEMIISLNADAIAFEEVENEEVLSHLFADRVNPKLQEEEKYTAFVWVPGNDRRGINVALATRLSVRGTLSFHDREFGPSDASAVKFSRDLLGVEINATPDYKFLFFVSHLKSKIGGEVAEEKRRMEAHEIRSILAEPAFGGKPFVEQDMVFAGDMNDDPDSRVIDVFVGDGVLKDVLSTVEPNTTFPTRGKWPPTRLDYLFASPSIAPRIEDQRIHRDGPAAAASDHYPVSVTVRVPHRP